jgi:predicted metal-dependent peptidase
LSRLEAIREQVAQEVLKSRGTFPAGIVRWANGRGKSQVSWQQILYSRVKRGAQLKSGQVNYSYSRPSRRQIPNVILPSLRRPVINVAIVIDSSGSMSQDDLNCAYSETRSVSMNNATGDLTLISCDAEATVIAENRLPENVELIGGGGTDMGEGLNLCEELRRIPDVVIVITDGYTPWPAQLPHRLLRTFVVVVVVGPCDVRQIPEWAETVCITNSA